MVDASVPGQPGVSSFRAAQERATSPGELGAAWAGDIGEAPPELLDCIIDTTPVWQPVVEALGALAPGGRLVINAIRKEAPTRTRCCGSITPVTCGWKRRSRAWRTSPAGMWSEFLALAARIPILPEIQEYALEDANQALLELKGRKIRGAKVLRLG